MSRNVQTPHTEVLLAVQLFSYKVSKLMNGWRTIILTCPHTYCAVAITISKSTNMMFCI